MLEKTLKALEFNKILAEIASKASSVPAREAIMEIRPYNDQNYIEELLDEVAEADKIAFEYATNLSFAFDDIGAILDKAEVMSVLTMGELLRVSKMLRVAYSVKNSIAKVPDDSLTRIKRIAASVYTDKELEESIESAIISDTEMHDRASEELRSIRIRIRKTGEQIKSKLYTYITSPTYAKYLQDNIVTVRGDRYVIPVKAEWRSAIPGLVHDQSGSGQTLYIEPMAVVELNNTLKTYILEEQAEIERILRAFTLKVSVAATDIRDSFTKIIKLDTVFAKAYYANSVRAVKPQMNTDGIIEISRGRHPLINPKTVVPTDVNLGKNFDLLFITGPNTGGKTVALKLVGLLTAMAMSGIFVPCAEAVLNIFDEVYCDIGDEQSIEQSLSTFSSHIANISGFIEKLNANSLVLLDELGAGTDPTEGAALAMSIAQYIKDRGAKAIITTHYNELKEYAVVTPRAENASMDFDPLTYSPTYRLIVGTPGVSNALLIAGKLGLPAEIVQRAKEGIAEGKLDFENVISSMEEARHNAMENEEKSKEMLKTAEKTLKEAERERDRLFIQREKLNENVRKETKRLVEEAMGEANEIISAMRALLDDPTEADLFKARKLKKSLEKYIVNEDNEFMGFGEEADGEISEGDAVLVKPLKAEGIVSKIDYRKNSAVVTLGKMNSTFKLDVLQKLKKAKKAEAPVPVHTARKLDNEAFSPELNLIGMTSVEARAELQKYLDKAILKGVNELRIIHGYGTGKLRETVRNYLKSCSFVDSYRDGVYGEGERGVTIVRLK
ncbi:MAG TPA: endonuclease MutS2 [Candidatus Stercoripulliclostridium merdigallinarum]|uniref:Endonuclease MutS2 n=1 Tax=Candidatus Stercoripulliclostridium merdigallinarum TaxID=2840951 RepID=A0A9D1MIV1_9FIRM|nr:endonuclease MutS2 [Candidatus Stercoripulliclostridium merdigallinarum]